MTLRFCIQEAVNRGTPSPCTQEQLMGAMHSGIVKHVCAQIASLDHSAADYSERKNALKRQLPIITPYARSFEGDGTRKSQNALPGGLGMIDIDNLANPAEVFTMQVEPFIEPAAIYFAAVTPSGHGLRLIFEREMQESVEDGMTRIAGICGFETIDGVTKDLSRASYIMPEEYVLYMNDGLFEWPSREAEEYWLSAAPNQRETVSNRQQCEAIAGQSEKELAHTPAETSLPAEGGGEVPLFKGIPYSDIVSTLISRMGGTPMPGERNTFYYSLAKYVRYICDFRPELVLRVLPDFGLPEAERKGECERACKSVRRSEVPQEVKTAVALTQSYKQQEEPDPFSETADQLPLPKLPRLLNLICRRLPDDYRPAMVIASLPILGALATRCRTTYIDGNEHSFSFISCLVSPMATGKNAFNRPINLLLTPINERDEIERQKEEEYIEALRTAKNSRHQPKDPHACPRNNGVCVSVAKLLQLMAYSEGKHLVGVASEMDTLLKSEKAGTWSQKSDIYRLAFDNGEYSSAVLNRDSFSGKVNVYYNLLIAGTPNSMSRFFSDAENGLISRVCFATLPNMQYAKMPVFQPYTEAEQKEIIAWARRLDQEEGMLRCKAIDDAIENWVEEKRIRCLEADSLAGDIFRRRSAVMGHRAAMLFYLLNNRTCPQQVIDLGLWVAEVCFRNSMMLWATSVESQNRPINTGQGTVQSLLSLLCEEFSTSDLMILRQKKGQSTNGESVRKVLARWKKSGLVERIGPNLWKKMRSV